MSNLTEKEDMDKWAEAALSALRSLRERVHKTHLADKRASLEAKDCYVCGPGVNEIISRGTHLLLKKK